MNVILRLQKGQTERLNARVRQKGGWGENSRQLMSKEKLLVFVATVAVRVRWPISLSLSFWPTMALNLPPPPKKNTIHHFCPACLFVLPQLLVTLIDAEAVDKCGSTSVWMTLTETKCA